MRSIRLSSFALAGIVLLLCSLPHGLLLSQSLQEESVGSGSNALSLIPTPRTIEWGSGHFAISKRLTICLTNEKSDDDRFAADQLAEEIRAAFGFQPRLTPRAKGTCVLLGRIGISSEVIKRLGALRMSLSDSLGKEGYVLQIDREGILVAANTGEGVFYGVQTLRQLIRSNGPGGAVPYVTIVDWPALRYRGWMHDISRGPIPTMAFLKNIIATMAGYKQNCFTLYTEHVFRLSSHPDIAPADGITAAEIAELTSFARRYHVELIGNAQSFGHMENILASPFYSRIRENSWVVTPAREETYAFLKELYAEVVPAYASTLFHINCDEVSGLGGGPAKRMVDSMGNAEVYAYHINRIADIIRPYGKRMLMWGDIAVGNPQIIDRLPGDLIVVSWGYHAAEAFDDAILPFKDSGFEFMVAPGVSCWGQVWPHMSNAVVNISNYVRDGAKLGAMGMMNTVWVDDGENLFSYNWHGLLWGAECSWSPARPFSGQEAIRDREARASSFNRACDALFFGMPGVVETLFLFDSLRAAPIRNIVTDQGVWSSMLEQYPEEVGEKALIDNDRAAKDAADLLERLLAIRGRVPRNQETIDAAVFAARRVLFTARKNLARIALARAIRSGQAQDIARARTLLVGLLDELHGLKADYVRLWQRENRSWWLNRVLEKYDRLGNELLDLDKVVFIRPENSTAEGKRRISLTTAFGDQPIYYTTDGRDPSSVSSRYEAPFWIDRSALVRARVHVNKQAYGLSERSIMVHKAVGKLGTLNSRYSLYNPAYAAGGEMALLDGLRGSETFSDGLWQGFQGQDLDIVIDLGVQTDIRRISVGLLQQSYSWILMPERVQVWTSSDGKEFALAKEIPNSVNPKEDGTITRDVAAEFEHLRTRFVRVVGKYPGKLPAWHHAAGNDAFIFADEIVVE